MKKNIAKLLVLVIAISLFSGCANKNKIGDELKTIKLWSGYCICLFGRRMNIRKNFRFLQVQ